MAIFGALAQGGLLLSQVYDLWPTLFSGADGTADTVQKQNQALGDMALVLLGGVSGEKTKAVDVGAALRIYAETRFQASDYERIIADLQSSLPYIGIAINERKQMNSSYRLSIFDDDKGLSSEWLSAANAASTVGAGDIRIFLNELDQLYGQATAAGAGAGAAQYTEGDNSLTVPTTGGAPYGGDGMGLFEPSRGRDFRPANKVMVMGPDGRPYWFGYLGQPVLFSRDVATVARVSRVVRRVGSKAGFSVQRRTKTMHSHSTRRVTARATATTRRAK